MFCPKCNSKVRDDAETCFRCNTRLTGAVTGSMRISEGMPTNSVRVDESTPAASSDPMKPVHILPRKLGEGVVVAGRYKIEGKPRSGGMGTVYRALDTKENRTVALKTLSPELTRTEDAHKHIDRFKEEVRHGKDLSHENIMKTFVYDEWDGYHFIIAEYITGKTLAEIIRGVGKIKSADFMSYMSGICLGLDYMHQKRHIHLDIKPSNIMIASDGTPKILDLGIAKAVREAKRALSQNVSMATVAYMAPEIARKTPPDWRADIYSLGCVVYECLTGLAAFPEGPTPNILPPMEDLSEPVETALCICLAADREKRFQSASDFLAALNGKSVPEGEYDVIPRRRENTAGTKCPECGHKTEDGDRHCIGCGSALLPVGGGIVCGNSNCKTLNEADSKFCISCGELLQVNKK